MRTLFSVRWIVLAAILWAAPASAREVYLNGVKLDASVLVKNQKFQGCEVRFDENGDVFITAKGFEIAVAPVGKGPEAKGSAAGTPTGPTAVPTSISKRYFLVAPQPRPGVVQYDLDLWVNGTYVTKVRSADGRTALEITKHVRPGENRVKVRATKNVGEKRLSTSPTDFMELIVGEGTVGGGTVSIEKMLLTYRRNASETGNFTDEYTFSGR